MESQVIKENDVFIHEEDRKDQQGNEYWRCDAQ